MPTYVYKFIETGETIEVRQSFSDDTLTEFVHPDTGETMPVKKVLLPVGVTFKGDGFYKTDSRAASKPKKSNGDDSGSSAGSDAKSSKDGKDSSGKNDGGSDGKSSTAASGSGGSTSSAGSSSGGSSGSASSD